MRAGLTASLVGVFILGMVVGQYAYVPPPSTHIMTIERGVCHSTPYVEGDSVIVVDGNDTSLYSCFPEGVANGFRDQEPFKIDKQAEAPINLMCYDEATTTWYPCRGVSAGTDRGILSINPSPTP